jgi:hypothetical protein
LWDIPQRIRLSESQACILFFLHVFNIRLLLALIGITLVAAANAANPTEASVALQRGDYAAAYPILVELADQGNSKAAVEVGLMHHIGRARAVNYQEAMDWYLKAFPKEGDALNNIGVLYRDGLGIQQNRKIAHVLFLTVHMAKMGNQATVMRANSNLRREIAELSQDDRRESLCYTPDYIMAYVRSKGTLKDIPEQLRGSTSRKRIRDLNWWLPGEIGEFTCPDGT